MAWELTTNVNVKKIVIEANDLVEFNCAPVHARYVRSRASCGRFLKDFEDVVHLSKSISSYWLKLSRGPEVSRPPRNGSKLETRERENGED